MADNTEDNAIDGIIDDSSNVITPGGDIRVDDFIEAAQQLDNLKEEAPKVKVKPTIPRPRTQEEVLNSVTEGVRIAVGGKELTADEILQAAAALQQRMAREATNARLDLNAAAQVMNLKNLRTKEGKLNFEEMTEEAAYDLDIPIIAKPFSTEDSLNVDLKDKSYTARWVNVNPLRLGTMRSRGFIYVVADDLASPLNIEIEVDAQGHFRCNDVVLMRITKERYFAAMRASHLRAMAAVNTTEAHAAASKAAALYMEKETGGSFVEAANRGKIKFYQTTM